MRALAIVRQTHAGCIEFLPDIFHRTKQQLALFGQDQTTRMAMEQRHFQIVLKRTDLSAHRRLAQTQSVTGMGEGARFGSRMKNAQLVPIHGRVLSLYSAACALGCTESQRSASSAAMQPMPAAVTA